MNAAITVVLVLAVACLGVAVLELRDRLKREREAYDRVHARALAAEEAGWKLRQRNEQLRIHNRMLVLMEQSRRRVQLIQQFAAGLRER